MAEKANKNETDAQKLVRITNKKVNGVLSALRTLGKLAEFNPTVEQRDKVFGTIQEELKRTHTAWTTKKVPTASGFAL